uniref:hypothetical protein n=1 Tax=Methanothermobacter thermautotrophicus TaxID=145262 RepID=UPI0015F33249|nr:hypothetical protein [Methanothermobacter thermautotrophicus]
MTLARRSPAFEKVCSFIEKSERFCTDKKIYTQKVYLDTRTACKLEIISYIESKSKSELSREAIKLFIDIYESKNGNIINKVIETRIE